jgi:hypothetical protein
VKSLLFVLMLLSARGCQFGWPSLSAEHRFYIETEKLVPVDDVRELPASIAAGLPMRAGPVASPLIAAGCGPYHCLIHYQQPDGRGTFHVLLYGLTEGKATLEWDAVLEQPTPDLIALRSFVLREATTLAGWIH